MNLETFPQGVILPKTIVDGLGATRVLPTRARVMLKHSVPHIHFQVSRLDCFTSGGPPPPYRTVCWSNAVQLCSSFASEVLKSISEAHTHGNVQPPRPRAAKGARAEQATTARPSVLVATRRTCHAPLALVAHALLQNSFIFSTDLLSARVCR